MNMLLILAVLSFFYFLLSYFYSNVNLLSGSVSMVIGIFIIFTDPEDVRSKFMRVLALLLILGGLSIMIIIFFFYTSPRKLNI